MKERLIWIDAIRGLAIILVVMGHAIAWNYSDWHEVCLFDQAQPVNYMAGGCIWQIIYSFHMALFFMVSGFLTGNMAVTRKNVFAIVKNKVIRLLVPYLATGYLIFFVRGNWGYWFLLTLFELSLLWIVMSWILDIINKNRQLWTDLIFMGVVYLCLRAISYLLPQTSVVVDSNILKYFIPFCVGTLIGRHKIVKNLVSNSKTYTFCLLAFVVLFSSRYIINFPQLYQVVSKLDFFLSVSSILACISIFHIFMDGVNKKIESFFAYLGILSMPIYILHNLFMMQMPVVGCFILEQNPVTSITFQLVYSCLISTISIILCIIAYHILRRSKTIRLLMFGEK